MYRRIFARSRCTVERNDALLPNAIVVSLRAEAVSFERHVGHIATDWGTPGQLTIRMPARGEPRPGLVIDGQQRMSALAGLPPGNDFPVVVVGFVSASPQMQLDQFVLVNRSKPLPRDLLNELLPSMSDAVPKKLEVRQRAGLVVERLRFDQKSIFAGRIRDLGPTGLGH